MGHPRGDAARLTWQHGKTWRFVKTIAIIEADFDRSPLGTASRLADDLNGTAVLRRTLGRVARCRRVDSVHLVVSGAQRDRAAAFVNGDSVRIETHEAGTPPWQELIRVARKWSLDGWRGGIAGACWFDEQTHAGVLAALGRRENAEAVLVVPAAAALVDPVLLDAMIEHHEPIADDMRMTFTPAPPGLAGWIARPDLLEELASGGVPPGALLAYKPEHPSGGYLNRPYCYQTPNTVAYTAVRLIADTHRAVATMRGLLDAVPDDATAEDVCRALAEQPMTCGELPREVEVELTTEDQLSETTLRPRGSVVPRRGPIDVAVVRRIVDELRRFDDSLLVLGGFGEPLLHPAFGEILDACRPRGGDDAAGVFGLAVRTNGLALDDEAIRMLAEHRVDIVTVTLDAHSRETYEAVHAHDGFEHVNARIDALGRYRRERGLVRPFVVPEMVKARENFGEMEAFYDHWLRVAGSAVIGGHTHCAGQLPDRAVMTMAPPRRVSCRRLNTRCMVLADGSVAACDQDFAGKQVVGNVNDASLSAIWAGSAYGELRDAHAAGTLDDLPLCPRCDEWHRP